MSDPAAPVTWTEFGVLLTAVVALVIAVIGGLVRSLMRVSNQLTEHRVETAKKFQEYVPFEAMREFERDIKQSIKDLREEFGRGIDRIAKLFNHDKSDSD
jgi:Flp pilus assembly pilin Flp